MTLRDLMNRYLDARLAWDEAHAISIDMHHKMRQAEAALVEAMLAQQLKTAKGDDGVAYNLKRSFNCSVTKDNTDAIRDWLVETEGDDEPFIEEKVSKPALTEYLKKKVEDGVPEDSFPAWLKVSSRPTLSVPGYKDWRSRQGFEDGQQNT